jgi:hypothetical protein
MSLARLAEERRELRQRQAALVQLVAAQEPVTYLGELSCQDVALIEKAQGSVESELLAAIASSPLAGLSYLAALKLKRFPLQAHLIAASPLFCLSLLKCLHLNLSQV